MDFEELLENVIANEGYLNSVGIEEEINSYIIDSAIDNHTELARNLCELIENSFPRYAKYNQGYAGVKDVFAILMEAYPEKPYGTDYITYIRAMARVVSSVIYHYLMDIESDLADMEENRGVSDDD